MRCTPALVSLVATTLPAQSAQPAPPPAAVASWSAVEASALAHCVDPAYRQQLGWSGGDLTPQYGPYLAVIDGGSVRFDDDGSFRGDEWDRLTYLVPRRLEAATRRVFCTRGDGAVAFTDNDAGTAIEGGRAVEAADVLAAGGKGTALDFPRTATRGRDGNLWLPADVVRRTSLRVHVRDEDGASLGRVLVLVVPPAEPQQACDAVLPAGATTTLLEGDAVIAGVPGHGLACVVVVEGVPARLPATAVQVAGATARLTVPREELLRVRAIANESKAIATLKNISSAQAQCQASGIIDVDKDGVGEYGSFAELAGAVPVRGGSARIEPPVLGAAFGKVAGGVVVRDGYCFGMLLPAKDGTAVPELPRGGADPARVDCKRAETLWRLYAWPLEAGVTGNRIFVVDQSGDVRSAGNADGRCSGPDKPPSPDAALHGASRGHMDDPTASNAIGRDGRMWVVIG
jgi:hypothetical protein